jgi:hypothetical protein
MRDRLSARKWWGLALLMVAITFEQLGSFNLDSGRRCVGVCVCVSALWLGCVLCVHPRHHCLLLRPDLTSCSLSILSGRLACAGVDVGAGDVLECGWCLQSGVYTARLCIQCHAAHQSPVLRVLSSSAAVPASSVGLSASRRGRLIRVSSCPCCLHCARTVAAQTQRRSPHDGPLVLCVRLNSCCTACDVILF